MVLLRYEAISKRSVAEANGVMRALRAVCRRAIKVLPERSDGSSMMKRVPTESLTGAWKTLPRKMTLLQPDELPVWWKSSRTIEERAKSARAAVPPRHGAASERIA
jgi:hypothetical protein